MSIIRAPRSKARYNRSWDGVNQGYARPPARPGELRTPQECYVCNQPMPIGTRASWAPGRRRWRHNDCSLSSQGNGF